MVQQPRRTAFLFATRPRLKAACSIACTARACLAAPGADAWQCRFQSRREQTPRNRQF